VKKCNFGRGKQKKNSRLCPRSVSVITLKFWNCGDAGHTSQGCSKPRDEASVARNRKEFRAGGKKRRSVGTVQRKWNAEGWLDLFSSWEKFS